MTVQDTKSSPSDSTSNVILTAFVIGSFVGAALVVGFKGGQENYWQYRAISAESQLQNAQQRAESAEAKYTALITGAAIK